MSVKVNNIIITGRLGNNPIIKTNDQGEKYMAIFNIANTFRWKKSETEYDEKTIWWSVIVYNKNVLKYQIDQLVKGSKVLIQGSIQNGIDDYTSESGYKIKDKVIIVNNYNSVGIVENNLSNYSDLTITGNLGQDPNIFENYDGDNSNALINIAHNYYVKNKNGEMDKKTIWLKVIFKDKYSVNYIDKYIKKGAKLLIRGVFSRDKQIYTNNNYTINSPYIYGKNLIVLNNMKGENMYDNNESALVNNNLNKPFSNQENHKKQNLNDNIDSSIHNKTSIDNNFEDFDDLDLF